MRGSPELLVVDPVYLEGVVSKRSITGLSREQGERLESLQLDPRQIMLRIDALVDIALDKRTYNSAVEELFNSNLPEFCGQEFILESLLKEEQLAFNGLKAGEEFHKERLSKCVELDYQVFTGQRLQYLKPETRSEWVKLLQSELAHATSKTIWSDFDQSLISHAARGIARFEEYFKLLRDDPSKQFVGDVSSLLVRVSAAISTELAADQLTMFTDVCEVARLLNNPRLHPQITRIEPQVRDIYLKLYHQQEAHANLSGDNFYNGEQSSVYGLSGYDDPQVDFESNRLALWADLYSTLVYSVITAAKDVSLTRQVLDILELTPTNFPFWPHVLQALAFCSQDALKEYLPKVVREAMESQNALLAIFYVLDLAPTKSDNPEHNSPKLLYDPYPLAANTISKLRAKERRELFQAAEKLIDNKEELLDEVTNPKEILDKLRQASYDARRPFKYRR